MSLNVKKIPCFVFPNTVKFYLELKSSHKQMLTLYNPYDFPVKFKVLSTAPNKYSVLDPEGCIGPQSIVDIVIRHNIPTVGNCNVMDKFRIAMQDQLTKQVLGNREIDVILLESEREDLSSERDFHSIPFSETSLHEDQRSFIANRPTVVAHSSNNITAVIIGLLCVAILLLPTQEEMRQPSSVPPYLHISVNLKLVLAYVLGLVSMVIFRT